MDCVYGNLNLYFSYLKSELENVFLLEVYERDIKR